MNINILIPQLFYDLIARVIPGAALIACAFLLSKGPAEGLRHLTAWTDSLILVLIGNLLAAHIIGSLLGGMWFRIYRLNLLWWRKDKKHGLWVKWLHGWAKNGEDRMGEKFSGTYGTNLPRLGQLDMNQMQPTDRVALMYDYTQLRCPKASARIAKLHAEQHMSGVLMIGCLLFAVAYLCFPSLRHPYWSLWGVEFILLFSALTAGWLAWHLEKRAGTALFFSWCLVFEKITDESRTPDSNSH
jgi:hypothetical protein